MVLRKYLRSKSLKNICEGAEASAQRCYAVISIKLLCNFIEIALRHACSPVNLLCIFRTLFLKNTTGRLLLKEVIFLASSRFTRNKFIFRCCSRILTTGRTTYCIIGFTRATTVYSDFVHVSSGSFGKWWEHELKYWIKEKITNERIKQQTGCKF